MFIRTVKGLRCDLGLTQQEFADILGISLRAYRNKENNESFFTQVEIIKIMLYSQISDAEAGAIFLSRSANMELYSSFNLNNFPVFAEKNSDKKNN